VTTSIASSPTTQAAQARIGRLRAAIGEGPHAFGFRPNQHLRNVLSAIGDQAAIALLEREKAKR
jgi:hypothetical protein